MSDSGRIEVKMGRRGVGFDLIISSLMGGATYFGLIFLSPARRCAGRRRAMERGRKALWGWYLERAGSREVCA